MNKLHALLLLAGSHLAIAVFAFMLGIYSLPILMAPADPSASALALSIKNTRYVATIADDLADSDWLHWGKGTFSLGDDYLVFQGELAPGPAYRLYLAKEFIETEEAFLKNKSQMVKVGEVNGFNNTILPIKDGINIEAFNTVIIWCESFDQFITSAQYKL